jgi:hypothetical protein
MARLVRLLSIGPRIQKLNDKLLASTARHVQLISLGLCLRHVVVDPQKRELTIAGRYLWFFQSQRRVKFGDVEGVTYGYQDWAMGSILDSAHDSLDLYSVGLRLYDGDDLTLFHFFGDGAFTHDGTWPDWMYWDQYAFDMSGTQDRDSRLFVDLLSRMIGVAVMPGRN